MTARSRTHPPEGITTLRPRWRHLTASEREELLEPLLRRGHRTTRTPTCPTIGRLPDRLEPPQPPMSRASEVCALWLGLTAAIWDGRRDHRPRPTMASIRLALRTSLTFGFRTRRRAPSGATRRHARRRARTTAGSGRVIPCQRIDRCADKALTARGPFRRRKGPLTAPVSIGASCRPVGARRSRAAEGLMTNPMTRPCSR
jgi:hypothetical protein